MTRDADSDSRLLQAIFDVPIYIEDGEEVHTVWVGGTPRAARTPDHDMAYEEAFAGMGGDPPPCLVFYRAVREHGFRNAFFARGVFRGSVRIRILAEWTKLIAPLYDKLIKEKFYLDTKLSTGQMSCRKLVDLILKYLDIYMDPAFEIPDDSWENEAWSNEYDVGNIVRPALFAMMDAIPEDKLSTNLQENAAFDMAFRVVSAVEYLQRACAWRLAGFSAQSFEGCDEVHSDVDKGFHYVARAMVSHTNTIMNTYGPKSDAAISLLLKYNNRAVGAASRVTKKYVLGAKP